MRSGAGIGFGIGAIFGIIALVFGAIFGGSNAKLAEVGAQIQGKPTNEQLSQIQHFFEHYKDLESGKWVKVLGWEGPESARKDIVDAIKAYDVANPKPAY